MDTASARVVLAHPVDVGRVEVERLAETAAQLARRPAHHEALLDELALHDGDGAMRDVVVVEAGVVAAGPRDDPDVDVVVAPQLLEVALRGVAAHERAPLPRIGGDPAHELAQLARVEIALERRCCEGSWSCVDLRVGGAEQQSGRVAPAQRGTHGVAERQLGRRDDGTVGAVDEPVDADLAQDRIDGAPAVGGDVEEDVRIADRGAAARDAGARAAAAPGRRASRSRRAAPGAPRGPRRRTRATPSASWPRSRSAPPTSPAARRWRVAGAGPGWTSSGAPRRSSVSSTGPSRSKPSGPASASAAMQAPTKPASSSRASSTGSGSARPTAAQAPNSSGSARTPSW